jgi:hypothetical protein
MGKKLITACLGLVALAAFALPAVASAANKPVITHPTGTALDPTGKSCTTTSNAICLTATNIGKVLLKSGDGTTTLYECTTVRLTGSLSKNKEGTIEGHIHTATFFGGGGGLYKGMEECDGLSPLPDLTVTTNGTDPVNTALEPGEDVANGTPYCIKSTPAMAEHEFQVRGGTCSEEPRKITFIFDTTPFFSGDPERECKYERTEAIKGTYTTHSTGDALLSLAAGPKTKFTGEAGNSVVCSSSLTLQMTFTIETDAATAEPMYISQLP